MEARMAEVRALQGTRSTSDLSEEERSRLEVAIDFLKCRVEDYLNAYEHACAEYLAERVSRDKFKANSREEIRTICDPNRAFFKDFMHPERGSKFRSIWTTHGAWFGPPMN